MKRILFFVFIIFSSFQWGWTQCAMCKASAETSLEAGANEAAGINTGVLYVLVISFFMLSFVGYLMYKGNKATKPL